MKPPDSDRQALEPTELKDRISRLEQRLARERDAREQAERIAEDGMRDLWRTNRDLEHRVAERTFELEQSLSAATMAAAAKERFLADLGHELTTPLHAVLGMLEFIDFSKLEPDDVERVDEIRQNATTLADLLRGLIELAGASGSAAPTGVTTRTASSWIDQAIEEWTLSAAMNGQLLVPSVVGGDEAVELDWGRLDKIMQAVVANAIQHGSPGTIEISVVVDSAALTLSVADSGPGLTPEELATADEPFVKHGDAGGIGIGLSIAHRLAIGSGGSLELASDGTATHVAIVLPRAR